MSKKYIADLEAKIAQLEKTVQERDKTIADMKITQENNKPVNYDYSCDICNKDYCDQSTLNEHLKSEKHNMRMSYKIEKLEILIEGSNEIVNDYKKKLINYDSDSSNDDDYTDDQEVPLDKCYVCKKIFDDISAFEKHKKSEKHKNKMICRLEQLQQQYENAKEDETFYKNLLKRKNKRNL
jgi:hypothetical protein